MSHTLVPTPPRGWVKMHDASLVCINSCLCGLLYFFRRCLSHKSHSITRSCVPLLVILFGPRSLDEPDDSAARANKWTRVAALLFMKGESLLLHSHTRLLGRERRLVVRWVDWAVGLDHDRRLLELVKWWRRLEHPLQGAVELWDHDLVVVLWSGGRREARGGRAERDHWGAGCSSTSIGHTSSHVSTRRHERHAQRINASCRRSQACT